MKVQVATFTFNGFQENTYVVYNELREAVIIDPGCYERYEQEELLQFIEAEQLNIKALLNTHCHIDHVLGNAFVLRNFEVPFYMHAADLPTLRAVSNYAHLYGIPGYELSPEPTNLIQDLDELNFGALQFKVIFAPGHAPGHVAFYNEENNLLLGGDILFAGSFGRYDLPGGSLEVLVKSIRERIFTLPENTLVYPGHGPVTSIAREKMSNPILQF